MRQAPPMHNNWLYRLMLTLRAEPAAVLTHQRPATGRALGPSYHFMYERPPGTDGYSVRVSSCARLRPLWLTRWLVAVQPMLDQSSTKPSTTSHAVRISCWPRENAVTM